MRVLILGAGGMLGHKLCQMYRNRYETWATVRGNPREYASYALLDTAHFIGGVDAADFDTITQAYASIRPDVVINCIGIIKQLPEAHKPIVSINTNALLPHRLATLSQAAGARFIHISTDCVFSGRKGMYSETDISDAEDLYGRTKFLGEVDYPGCLTLRTSIIGRELKTTSGLVEWFLSNQGKKVRGFRRAIYSGFTTQAMASIIATLLEQHPQLSGMYQVSSEPINKYDLLCLIRDAFGLSIEIEPYDEVVIDRSLDSTRFRAETGFVPPDWSAMITEMAQDSTPYELWRR